MTKGYAHISSEGVISVPSVSPTEIGAMVNALIAIYDIPIFNNDADFTIRDIYNKVSKDGMIVKVTIEIVK